MDDVRAALPAIHVPTLVIQRLDDRITPPWYGRYLASHIAGARYFEQPGDHALRFAGGGDMDALFDEIEHFLAGQRQRHEPDRVLATILLAKGPSDAAVQNRVRAHRGRLINSTETGILATFDSPREAIRCAAAVRDDAAAEGLEIRTGIHTGEVQFIGDVIAGLSVQIADAVASLARPAEILVTRTVRDLVVGAGISLADRGTYELSGVPDQWPLFAVSA